MVIGRRLFRILGKRAFFTFGLITFLVSGLLATVNLTSRYALKTYIEDQLRRTPWDLAVYQRGVPGDTLTRLSHHVAAVDGVTRVERLAFLRARFPEAGEVRAEVDGTPVTAPWLCLLAASDLSILPPEVSFALDRVGRSGAVLALIGPERAMGRAFVALQGTKDFALTVRIGDERRGLFETPIRSVIRLERDELNRWLMDQTGSVSYIPSVGIVLLMPFQEDVLLKFDAVAAGMVPPELLGAGDADYGHIQLAEYEPEMVYLGKLDRQRIISGWDIAGSLERVDAVHHRVYRAARSATTLAARREWRSPAIVLAHDPGEEEGTPAAERSFVVDSTTEVLLQRMERIARLVGLMSLLVALPLLWMAWVLAANLSGLLMLNERRTLGLMRLRGIPGRVLGRAFLVAIGAGGTLGGVLGVLAGSIGALLVYERGRLPLDVLLDRRQLLLFALFLLVTLLLAFLVSRRLIRYATTISPLEASARVALSEASHARVRFGPVQALALAAGCYVLVRWIAEFSMAERLDPRLVGVERALDFVGLPLFLYGLVTLLASRPRWIERFMHPIVRPIGGRLGGVVIHHIAVTPHRTLAFLLIVALMASVSLYPAVSGSSFQNRAERGARVQLGAEWQLVFNSPDLADVGALQGHLAGQFAALKPGIDRLIATIAGTDGVESATYLVEAVLPNFYLPGYGLKGVPLYLVEDANQYVARTYSEPQVGTTAPFADILHGVGAGAVATAPSVAEFWRLSPGSQVLLGMDGRRETIAARSSGTIAFLPGLPPRSVTDRQGYVQARVDYLNHLFNSNAYLVAAAGHSTLRSLEVLIPRVIVLVNTTAAVPPDVFRERLIARLPIAPLETHDLTAEVGKLGTDMYIALALANLRVYLVGGLLLALLGIVAIGMANYTESRRTLGLLRIRGANPVHLWRFLAAMMLSPALLGLVVGSAAALIAGFGLANYIWALREVRTVVQLLPTRIVWSPLTGSVALTMVALLLGVATAFSWWQYRHTAHQNVR